MDARRPLSARLDRRSSLWLPWLAALGCRRGIPTDGRDTPVVLAHGMFADRSAMNPIASHLRQQGFTSVHFVDLSPVDGTARVAPLAAQLDTQIRAILARTAAPKVDVVGYSLGALVARYWLQRSGGKLVARRFVSLAGPQHGALGGVLPVRELARDLRPASDLLIDLDRDRDPWGSVEVASFFSPFDVVILPTETAILQRSRVIHAFLAPSHHHMSTDAHVLRAIESALSGSSMTIPRTIPTARQLEERVERAIRERLHR